MSFHVCRPATVTFRSVRHCPTCDCRRRMVDVWAVWYGSTTTCCACGDSWADGYRLQRPFARGWRKAASARARQRWADAPARSEAVEQQKRMLDFDFGGAA